MKSKIDWKEIRKNSFIAFLVAILAGPINLLSPYLLPGNASTGDEGFTMGLYTISVSAWLLIGLVNVYLDRSRKSILGLLYFILTTVVIILGVHVSSQLSNSELTGNLLVLGLFLSSIIIGLTRAQYISEYGFASYLLVPSITVGFQIAGGIITFLLYMVSLFLLGGVPFIGMFLPSSVSLAVFVGGYWFVISLAEQTIIKPVVKANESN